MLSTRGRPAIDPRQSCGEAAAGKILRIVLFGEGTADVGRRVKVDRRAAGPAVPIKYTRARVHIYILGKVPARRSTGPPPCKRREAVYGSLSLFMKCLHGVIINSKRSVLFQNIRRRDACVPSCCASGALLGSLCGWTHTGLGCQKKRSFACTIQKKAVPLSQLPQATRMGSCSCSFAGLAPENNDSRKRLCFYE